MSYTEADKKLTAFFRQLATDVENEKLTPAELQKAGEFYISWKVRELNETDEDLLSDEFEFYRFLTMGLYVYKFLLN